MSSITEIPSWIPILSLMAAAQGFFLALVLASKKENSLANHMLAMAMSLFSFELVTAFYHGSGLDVRYPYLIGATNTFPILYSPLFLLYAQALTGSLRRVTPKLFLHFVPFALVFIYTIPFHLLDGSAKLEILRSVSTSPWVERLFIIGNLIFVYSLVYIVATIVVIERHRHRIRDRFSSLDRVNLNWLRTIVLGGLGTWLIAFGFYVSGVVDPDGQLDPVEGYSVYISLALAAYIYAIGYLGLRQPEIFRSGDASDMETELPLSYAKSGITDSQAADIKRRLVALMDDDAPYRDPELTLTQLAELLGVTPHNLSQVINSNVGMSFYDFINGYRVDEVKKRIEEDANASLTLLSIGLDAGFNSKSTFNAVFKKISGCTPSEFRKQHTDDWQAGRRASF